MPPTALPDPLVGGSAGASAQREYERRQAKDEQRTRDKWGPLGGLAVTLSGERSSTEVWARGAIGERKVGARLDQLRSDRVVVLHDRRIPRSRANIDHIVITECGIWVVDTKRYVDKRPALRVEGGFIRPRTETLTIGGSRSSHLVEGVLRQVESVKARVGDVIVGGVLCFVDADWPLIGLDFETQGVLVTWPRELVKRIQRDNGQRIDVAAVAHAIANSFTPA